MGDVDGKSLSKELETCRHILMDSEMENRRHGVYNVAMETLASNCLLEKLYVVFDSLKCVATLNVTFGCAFKKREM